MNIGKQLIKAQRNELTEHMVYKKLASIDGKNKNNKRVLEKISSDELTHYNFWRKFTSRDVKPFYLSLFLYYWLSRLFGINFGIRMMERGEMLAKISYKNFKTIDPKVEDIIKEEEEHEKLLIDLLDKAGLKYTSSVVLGLNDALVELTGVLAGLTLALQKTKIVAVVGLITGIAASLSMASSEYLSKREENDDNPFNASIYTGIAYITVVAMLIFPYFIFTNPFFCLGISIVLALSIIFLFNFYISTAKGIPFRKRFIEMALISVSIALVNFFIGIVMRRYFNIDI